MKTQWQVSGRGRQWIYSWGDRNSLVVARAEDAEQRMGVRGYSGAEGVVLNSGRRMYFTSFMHVNVSINFLERDAFTGE